MADKAQEAKESVQGKASEVGERAKQASESAQREL